jgi:diacylglycerol kinase family enzyme
MKFSVIINPLSRSVPKDGARELEAAIRAAGHDIVEMNCRADCLQDDVCAAAGSAADGVIAWGGDGTLACALTACGSSGLPVLTLPGGTMNMLPKRLHGDGHWHEILDRILRKPAVRMLPAGEAAGQRFYIAALFGRLTGLAETREAVRKGELLEAAHALVEGEILDVETRLRLSWEKKRASSGMSQQTISAVAAAVALNSGHIPRFEVASIDPDSTLDLLSTALDAVVHGWKEADPVEHDISEAVTVHDLNGADIPATLDGERVTFTSPVRIRLVKEAARVICAEDSP